MAKRPTQEILPGSIVPTVEESAHVRFERREISAWDNERFDRIAFALRAVRLLKPEGMTVAVFEGNFSVHVQEGPDLANGPDARWGMIAVPSHASRAEIAVAVASLAGRAHDPFVLNLVMADPSRPAS